MGSRMLNGGREHDTNHDGHSRVRRAGQLTPLRLRMLTSWQTQSSKRTPSTQYVMRVTPTEASSGIYELDSDDKVNNLINKKGRGFGDYFSNDFQNSRRGSAPSPTLYGPALTGSDLSK